MRSIPSFVFCLLAMVLSNQALGKLWNGPFNKVWTEEQCSNIKQKQDLTLEACQDACRQDAKCTAIVFNSRYELCSLIACPRPVPEPILTFPGFLGYEKMPEA